MSSWIKFRTSLVNDGRVRVVAKKLKASNALGNATTNAYSVTVIGALVTLWSLADQYADENGVIFGYDKHDIDDEVGIENFCDSLPNDWIDLSGEWVKLPNYVEHNGATAKKRANTAKRVANHKNANAQSVTEKNEALTHHALPREEKKRKEKINKKISLSEFLKSCEASGEMALPETDTIFEYFEKNKIPQEWALLSWNYFKRQYCESDEKKYIDWRAVYRKAIRGNWLKLWYVDDATNTPMLTTVGKTALSELGGEA